MASAGSSAVGVMALRAGAQCVGHLTASHHRGRYLDREIPEPLRLKWLQQSELRRINRARVSSLLQPQGKRVDRATVREARRRAGELSES